MTTDTVGGVWTYTLDLLREYEKSRLEILLVSMGRMPSSEQLSEVAQLARVTFVPTPFKLEWMTDPWRDVDASRDLLVELSETFQPDIVHLNGYAHASAPFRAPKLVVAHSCVLSWWRAAKGLAAPCCDWQRYQDEVTKGLNAADLVVAPTRAMLDMLSTEYGFSARQAVIYNGSAVEECEWESTQKDRLVFCAGRIWDEAKNIAALREAAKTIHAPVYLAGDGAFESASRSASAENVQFLGKFSRPEVARWMRQAAVYCLPALYEPFGLSVLEAARSGCALVLGDIPTLRELWPENCARFVDPRDPKSIANAVNALLKDKVERERLQRNAAAQSRAYSTEAMAKTYLSAYDRMQRDHAPRAESLHGGTA